MADSIARRWRLVDEQWRRTPRGSEASDDLRWELDELVAEYRRLIDDQIADHRLMFALLIVAGVFNLDH